MDSVLCFVFSSQLEEKVQHWQSSAASSLNPWFSCASCWSEMVLPALHFLAAESKGGYESDKVIPHSLTMHHMTLSSVSRSAVPPSRHHGSPHRLQPLRGVQGSLSAVEVDW